MATLFLNNNKGFSWFSNGNVSIKGSFFDEKNNYFEKEIASSFFKNITNLNQFKDQIKVINGIFTVLIQLDNELFMACDATRIFPLFYIQKNNQLFISDDIVYLKEKLNISTVDIQASEEFLAAGHTLGKKTLLSNVYQLQSSEYLCFKNDKIIKQGFFFSYATNTLNISPYYKLKEQAIIAFENSFKRLITSLNNRQVILPLSGGYDSRLIAVMLKKHNYKNVICYTYGKKNNLEIENSRKTAETLNFKWIFIEYSEKIIDNYINTEIFRNFSHYTCRYSSMPSLQDFFAVKHLFENKIIESNAIFIPGHSGDLIGGSQIIKVIPNDLKSNEISKLLLHQKHNLNKTSGSTKKQILNRIEKQISLFDNEYKNKYPHSVFENYDIKEKIAKIIFKASSVYTFFNYQHRFPFWDKELLTFFKNVPLEYKKMKYLYDDILKNHYFETFNVNFKKEIQPSKFDLFSQKIKELIKQHAPYFVRKHFLIKNDWLNSLSITKRMKESMKKNNIKYHKKIKVFNELNIQWYYYNIIGKIKK